MNETRDDAWYVVQTQVNAEARAARNLIRQGFEIYLPRYLKRRSHARKIEKVAVPLFPRYLFVRIDMANQRWRSIRSTFGVSSLVTRGSDPAPIATEVLHILRAKEDQSGLIAMNRRSPFIVGEKVRILAGAFTDIVGLFDGLADRERVAVLLDLLGQKVRVSIDMDLIAAA